ncbi:hypothetical protein BcepSauron_040 [Burkholderia phage BcepSauron]|uniref:Uncharacterized protein n=1 Tax=Burkholderia phage BcepSauron TaxID=2530033 RepID=A0A482MMW2_9CAUD|nr:hypothetical protein H1O17_gp040 [Burkholderia phage BcepSauron]QBQ74420.1 hypothetical protein BcepSauron_040 [Burkholderia phage BcepSauron]
MSHMIPHVEFGQYFSIDTDHGTEIVPADVIGRTVGTHVEAFANYLEGKPYDADEVIEPRDGWLARMTAPGYLDRTDWTVHATEKEAREYLADTYDAEFEYDEDTRTERADEARESYDMRGWRVASCGSWTRDGREMRCTLYVEREGQDTDRVTFVVGFLGNDVRECYAITDRGVIV